MGKSALTQSELDRLEALAKAATPGPWEDDCRSINQLTDGGKGYPLDVYPDSQDIVASTWSEDGPNGVLRAEDAAYIAAANPSVLLRLLDQVKQSQRALDLSLLKKLDELPTDDEKDAEIDRLTAQVREAEALKAWQPIKTAPNDMVIGETCGTLVLVWGEAAGYATLYGFVARDSVEYTHWQPLSPPPARLEKERTA